MPHIPSEPQRNICTHDPCKTRSPDGFRKVHVDSQSASFKHVLTLIWAFARVRRRAAVKAAMRHSWNGYVQYAWGADELLPVSRRGGVAFCGTGATMLDALGTLWIMGLHREFARARDWVASDLSLDSCALPQTPLTPQVLCSRGGDLHLWDP